MLKIELWDNHNNMFYRVNRILLNDRRHDHDRLLAVVVIPIFQHSIESNRFRRASRHYEAMPF